MNSNPENDKRRELNPLTGFGGGLGTSFAGLQPSGLSAYVSPMRQAEDMLDAADAQRKQLSMFQPGGLADPLGLASYRNPAQDMLDAADAQRKQLSMFQPGGLADPLGLASYRNPAQEMLDAADVPRKQLSMFQSGGLGAPLGLTGYRSPVQEMLESTSPISSGLGAFQPTLSSLATYASPMRQAEESTVSHADKKQRVQETPYLNASVAPALKQKASRQEIAVNRPRLVEESRPRPESDSKIVPVNPAVETNKLLRELNAVTADNRQDQRQLMQDQRQLIQDQRKLLKLMEKVLSNQVAIESKQQVLDAEIQELKARELEHVSLKQEVVTINDKLGAMYCDVNTIAKHVHVFFGPETPEIEHPDESEDTDEEQT